MEPTLTQFITRLFAEMNIKDFSDDIDADEAFELVKQKLAPLKEQLVDEAVDAAFAQSKLHPDELDFALGMAKENLEAFNAFVAARRPIPKLSAVLKARGFKPPLRVVPSKLQDEINKQIGVSPELFKKYNPEG